MSNPLVHQDFQERSRDLVLKVLSQLVSDELLNQHQEGFVPKKDQVMLRLMVESSAEKRLDHRLISR